MRPSALLLLTIVLASAVLARAEPAPAEGRLTFLPGADASADATLSARARADSTLALELRAVSGATTLVDEMTLLRYEGNRPASVSLSWSAPGMDAELLVEGATMREGTTITLGPLAPGTRVPIGLRIATSEDHLDVVNGEMRASILPLAAR